MDHLGALHLEIDQCDVCHIFSGFQKPAPMIRGSRAPLMIIGQGPGRTEATSGRPFSGQSGRRLDEWLVRAGASHSNPRENVYFTSIIKCISDKNQFDNLAANCRKFLINQISIIDPLIIWTLGEIAYYSLGISTIPYNKALFSVFASEQETLIREWPVTPIIIPLPHPSGLNRLLNDQLVKDNIETTILATTSILNSRGIHL